MASESLEALKRGHYIVLEGGEGVGKSTQAARLAAHIGAQSTRETGGTPIGARLRAILHDVNATISDEAELFIVAADRAEHINTVVRPTVQAGRDIVSDRCWVSTLAYQGFGRKLDIDTVLQVTRIATKELFMPDLVIVLTADDETVNNRLSGRDLDRFEQAGDDFHQRVKNGYRYFLDNFGGVEIDASRNVDEVHEEIMQVYGKFILEKGL
jgi:dTMP kinase